MILEGHEILLDTNLHNIDPGFSMLIANCRLVDLIDQYDEGTPITTYNKRNKLDIILETLFVSEHMINAEALYSSKGIDSNPTLDLLIYL